MPNDTGNGMANLMLGNFNNYTQASGDIYPWFRFWEFDLYAQDSWKVSKRLTIEYGMRFVHMTPTYTWYAAAHRVAKARGRSTAWISASTTRAKARPSI